MYQSDRNKGNGKRRAYVERRRVSDSEDSDYDDSDDDGEIIRPRQVLRGPISASYPTSQLTPLTTSPAWHEINAQLNIHLTGPDSLQGLCDEAHFARSCLTKTSSALLKKSTQAEAARFCIEQIKDEDTTEDLRVAFAKLLPHSLSHAKPLPKLMTDILNLQTQHYTIYNRLPLETTKAITDYVGRLRFPSGSQKSGTAAPSCTNPKSSTKATTSQKPSTTPTSSTARRAAQKSSPPLRNIGPHLNHALLNPTLEPRVPLRYL